MGWYDRKVRQVRDLSCGDTRIFLELEVRRLDCRNCGKVKRERLDFLADNPLYTKRFAYFVGRRCRQASIAAGVVGLLSAPFIDRFDRRTLLLFMYAGFTVATLLCGLATNAHTLLIARAIGGAFGGISGSLCLAIVSDMMFLPVRTSPARYRIFLVRMICIPLLTAWR